MNKQIEEMAKDLCEYNRRGICDLEHKRCDLRCTKGEFFKQVYSADYRKMPENIGDFSDGYHTFNELYHHRAVLFSVICNMFPEKAWKSRSHDTGYMFDGVFIVGIETEQGQATYHYVIDPYWDMFKVKELDKAPKWDGHTACDAIERIGSISAEGYRKQEWIPVNDRLPEPGDYDYYLIQARFTINGDYTIPRVAKFRDGKWFVLDYDDKSFEDFLMTVTHWMPLTGLLRGGKNDA